ncbi:hypothetical protein ANCCEY_13605 [Ancylostoma ceylanicum]|uniref:Reverse transcriptase domain-containing protein n=1 Tax=Ancylostoma ceylanicum TaxID=53326 RepID=A0A0D6L6N5_9BILA|nr:hypothetical protein ANCCEY_13605 [Ancylostoma ceylanicum]
MPRATEDKPLESQLEKEISKDRYDELSKDVQKFVSDEDPDSKERDLIPMKLDEDAYRKYADDVLPMQPHEVDFETTVANLQKLFASKKTLIRRRLDCPRLTASYVPFCDYANIIKRMDEDAQLNELDHSALETPQFVASLQDPSLRKVRLRMLRRLDAHGEDTPLTIEDFVAECENFTALRRDNTDMEGCHDIHAVQKKKVKCGGPHYRSTCPLLSTDTGQKMRQKSRRRSYRRKRSQCKNVVIFATENARTYRDVTIRGRSLRFQLDTGTDITLISRQTWKELLKGGQLFTQIDFAEAYLQVEVEEESKELSTVNTHRSLYRYNRLPSGVKSAPCIFEQITDSMICGLEDVAAYLDDVIVTDRTHEEHRRNLEALFGRIHEYGFRVRME